MLHLLRFVAQSESLQQLLAAARPGDTIPFQPVQRSVDSWMVFLDGFVYYAEERLYVNDKIFDENIRHLNWYVRDSSPSVWTKQKSNIFKDKKPVYTGDTPDDWRPPFDSSAPFVEIKGKIFHGGNEICTIHNDPFWDAYPREDTIVLESGRRLILNNGNECIFEGPFEDWQVHSQGIVIQQDGQFFDPNKLLLDARGIEYMDWKVHPRGILLHDRQGIITFHVTS